MEKELNIAAILKDKPEGTKLWSPIFGDCNLYDISKYNELIHVETELGSFCFGQDGRYTDEGEVCLFPSKAMRDWEKFTWKKGDILQNNCGYTMMFFAWFSDDYTEFAGKYAHSREGFSDATNQSTSNFHKVSDIEANEFIKKIEEHYGGKLNLETLEIEKPEFKDGDIVYAHDCICGYIYIYRKPRKGIDVCYCYKINKGCLHVCDINNSYDCTLPSNTIIEKETRFATDSEKQQLFDELAKEDKRWNPDTKTIEDLPKKCELKPFDKVLVRDGNGKKWRANIFSHLIKSDYPYQCLAYSWKQCIPYNEETKYLLGTTDDWEGGEG